MAAYCLFDNIDVMGQEKLRKYGKHVAPIIAQYGGRYLALGGHVDVVEGDWRPTSLVLLEFPSLEQVHRWYDSEEYRELKALRLSAARTNAVFFEGL